MNPDLLSIFSGLVSDLSAEARLILGVVGGMGLLGVSSALRSWLRLRQERAAYVEMSARLEKRQAQNLAWDEETEAGLVRGVKPTDALVCRQAQDFHALRKRGALPEQRTLSDSLHTRLSLRLSLLNYIVGTLILIGLTGTLLGLTQAVIGLSSSVQTHHTEESTTLSTDITELRKNLVRLYSDVDKLFASVKYTLAGMHTAFLTSLLSIATTVFLSFFRYRLQNQQMQLLADVEDFITKELIPFFFPFQGKTEATQIGEVVKIGIQQALAPLKFNDSVVALLRALNHNAQQTDALLNMTDGLAARVGVEVRTGVQQVLEPLQVSQALTTLLGALEESVRQLAALSERKEDQAEQAQEHFSRIFVLLREQAENRQQFDKNIGKALAHQETLSQNLAAAVERIGISEVALRDVTGPLRQFCADNIGILSTLEQGIATQRDLRASLTQFIEASEDLFDRRLTGILSQQHERFLGSVRERMEEDRNLVKTLRDGVELQNTTNGLLFALLPKLAQENGLTTAPASPLESVANAPVAQGLERKMEELLAQQRGYFSASLKEQQRVVESLKNLHSSMTLAVATRLFERCKPLFARLRQLRWPFPWKKP